MDIVAFVQGLAGPAVYAAIGGFALLESAAFVGLVVPGETVMLLGGALAGLGQASLPAMIAAAAVGAILGDLVGYLMGRALGPRMRTGRWGRWIGEQRWERAEALMRRRGPAAVLFARWIVLLRALVPAVAGAARMPLRQFLLWNAIGGSTWAATVLTVGYLAGSSWTAAQGWIGIWAAAMTAVTVALLAAPVLRRVWRRPSSPTAEVAPCLEPVPVGAAGTE